MAEQDSTSIGQKCSICEQFKTFAHFTYRNDSKKYRSNCKSCRNQSQQKYQKTDAGKLVQYRADQIRNKKFPNRRKARSTLFQAIKSGILIKLPCFICGNKAEAHHSDYDKPLNVTWLCKQHHKEAHLIQDNIC